MIVIISPTTTLNFEKEVNIDDVSIPYFLEDTNYLVDILKTYSKDEVSSLMNLSDDLSSLNLSRYKKYGEADNLKCPSIFAFDGEVFSSMNRDSFDKSDLEFANNTLRILSGLYGVLKPYDMIEAYRLEMKSKFSHNTFNNLYTFWKSKITEFIISDLDNHEDNTLINLASLEYIKAIDLKKLKLSHNFIDIGFMDFDSKSNSYKTKGLYAKKARGYMINFIVKNKVNNSSKLKKFNTEGYVFNEDLSTNEKFIFTRK